MPGVQFTNQIDMNGFKVTEVGPGTTGTDAVNLNQLTAVAPQGFAVTVGDGVASSFTVTHGFGTTDVIVSVYEVSSGEEIAAGIQRSIANDVVVTFGAPPTIGQYRVLVIPVP